MFRYLRGKKKKSINIQSANSETSHCGTTASQLASTEVFSFICCANNYKINRNLGQPGQQRRPIQGCWEGNAFKAPTVYSAYYLQTMHRFADATEDLNKKLQREASSPSALTGLRWERPLALQSVHTFLNKPEGRLT